MSITDWKKQEIHVYGVSLCLIEPRLLIVDFGTVIGTPELLDAVAQKIHRLWPGKKMAVLAKASSATNLSGIAKKTEDPVVSSIGIAAAFYTNSTLTRILGNVFANILKAPFPFRIFEDEEKALAWLRTHIVKSGIEHQSAPPL